MNVPRNPNFNDNESVSRIIQLLQFGGALDAANACVQADVTAVKACF